MENEDIEINKKKTKAKIMVPLIIVLIIAGIWFAKELQRGPAGDVMDGGDGEIVIQNEDFALNATEEFDLERLKAYGLPMMIDFGSATCPPCREMAPALKKVHGGLLEKVIIKYVDVDNLREITADYPIRVVPTQLFFDKDGKPFMPADPEASQMLIYTAKDTEEHVFTAHEGALTERQMLEIFAEMGMEE